MKIEHCPILTGIDQLTHHHTIPNNDSYTFSNFRFILFVGTGGSLGSFRFKFFVLVGDSFTVMDALSNMEIISSCLSLLGPARLDSWGKHN